MNKSTIKILCIFIMIIYCLAPLGAIDLNQDNNANLYDLNDTANDTIDDASNEEEKNVEIKEINNTDIATSNSTIDKNNREISEFSFNKQPIHFSLSFSSINSISSICFLFLGSRKIF